LITVNNLEKNDNVVISMPNKIYSNNGKQAPKNYSQSTILLTGQAKVVRV